MGSFSVLATGRVMCSFLFINTEKYKEGQFLSHRVSLLPLGFSFILFPSLKVVLYPDCLSVTEFSRFDASLCFGVKEPDYK